MIFIYVLVNLIIFLCHFFKANGKNFQPAYVSPEPPKGEWIIEKRISEYAHMCSLNTIG